MQDKPRPVFFNISFQVACSNYRLSGMRETAVTVRCTCERVKHTCTASHEPSDCMHGTNPRHLKIDIA